MNKISISEEEIKEVKNIALGRYYPLLGFMDKADMESVISSLKLTNGSVFPIPVYLAVSQSEAANIRLDNIINLVDKFGETIARLEVCDKYVYSKRKIAKNVFRTENEDHPGVNNLYKQDKIFIAGKVTLIDNITYGKYDLTPKQNREIIKQRGWKTIAGFQTRNPIHKGHEYIQNEALKLVDGLFINPVVGLKKPGDFKDELIIKSYEIMLNKYYPKNKVVFSVLPYVMRYAGPREAVLHAIIRKNYGCTHFIVGRDHAGVGHYYKPYEAQEIFNQIGDLGVKIIKINDAFYCNKCKYVTNNISCCHSEKDSVKFSATLIRSLIQSKKSIPPEIIRPEISKLLQSFPHPFYE